jgi:hypothetical protein
MQMRYLAALYPQVQPPGQSNGVLAVVACVLAWAWGRPALSLSWLSRCRAYREVMSLRRYCPAHVALPLSERHRGILPEFSGTSRGSSVPWLVLLSYTLDLTGCMRGAKGT